MRGALPACLLALALAAGCGDAEDGEARRGPAGRDRPARARDRHGRGPDGGDRPLRRRRRGVPRAPARPRCAPRSTAPRTGSASARRSTAGRSARTSRAGCAATASTWWSRGRTGAGSPTTTRCSRRSARPRRSPAEPRRPDHVAAAGAELGRVGLDADLRDLRQAVVADHHVPQRARAPVVASLPAVEPLVGARHPERPPSLAGGNVVLRRAGSFCPRPRCASRSSGWSSGQTATGARGPRGPRRRPRAARAARARSPGPASPRPRRRPGPPAADRTRRAR